MGEASGPTHTLRLLRVTVLKASDTVKAKQAPSGSCAKSVLPPGHNGRPSSEAGGRSANLWLIWVRFLLNLAFPKLVLSQLLKFSLLLFGFLGVNMS